MRPAEIRELAAESFLGDPASWTNMAAAGLSGTRTSPRTKGRAPLSTALMMRQQREQDDDWNRNS
jgi:hypothetical protein